MMLGLESAAGEFVTKAFQYMENSIMENRFI